MSGKNLTGKGAKTASRNYTLSSFNKREIFKHLNKFGCSEESFDAVMCRFRMPKTTAIDHLNDLLEQSEKYLHQECSSFCFDNVEAWLRIMKKNNCLSPLESFAEYIAQITNLEELPQASELNGVDLSAAYRFIENGLLGLPQSELCMETAEFIVQEMKALIEAVNTDEGDEAAYSMYDKLEQYQISHMVAHINKLDPLDLG